MKITDAETFGRIVKSRANDRVQARLKVFREEMQAALKKLGFVSGGFSPPNQSYLIKYIKGTPEERLKEAAKVNSHYTEYVHNLALVTLGSVSKGGAFPKELWRDEEAAVEKELLGTLDEMQKAILSANSPMDLSQGEEGGLE